MTKNKIWAPPRLVDHDVDAACVPGSGVFGLDSSVQESRVVLVPVGYDGTCSRVQGTGYAPVNILAASHEVELHSERYGDFWRQGIAWGEECEWQMRNVGRRSDPAAIRHINKSLSVRVDDLLDEGHVVGVVGGEHSVSLGAIQAAARRCTHLTVVHLDAHADLRDAYEGHQFSHASVMRNVLETCDNVHVVSWGVRAFGAREAQYRRLSAGRVRWCDHADQVFYNVPYPPCREEDVHVYVTLDVDALEPQHCPHTGTPEPGGLRWDDVTYLLGALSRFHVVGFDLVEVGDDPWDAYVGAKLLYELCGMAVRGQRE